MGYARFYQTQRKFLKDLLRQQYLRDRTEYRKLLSGLMEGPVVPEEVSTAFDLQADKSALGIAKGAQERGFYSTTMPGTISHQHRTAGQANLAARFGIERAGKVWNIEKILAGLPGDYLRQKAMFAQSMPPGLGRFYRDQRLQQMFGGGGGGTDWGGMLAGVGGSFLGGAGSALGAGLMGAII